MTFWQSWASYPSHHILHETSAICPVLVGQECPRECPLVASKPAKWPQHSISSHCSSALEEDLVLDSKLLEAKMSFCHVHRLGAGLSPWKGRPLKEMILLSQDTASIRSEAALPFLRPSCFSHAGGTEEHLVLATVFQLDHLVPH